MIYAEGGNYRIEVADGLARCEVWRRPDLDATTGARLAEEKIGHFAALASSGVAQGMLFLLDNAPPVVGPRTQEAIGAMLHSWNGAGRPVALVSGASATQQLQLQRIVADRAFLQSRVFASREEAVRWLEKEAARGGACRPVFRGPPTS